MTLSSQTLAFLAVHPWLTALYRGSGGALVLLDPAGMLVLLGGARQALLNGLHAALEQPAGTEPMTVRRLDVERSATGLTAVDRVLAASRPSHATVLAETERDGCWAISRRLPQELTQFNGHFPQAAVLPGALPLAWALALAARQLATTMRCSNMQWRRFQRLLHPGDRVELGPPRDRKVPAADHPGLHFNDRLEGAQRSSARRQLGLADD